MEEYAGFKVGDTVWVSGQHDPLRRATWTIRSITQATTGVVYAHLWSGRTGRRGTFPIERLEAFVASEVVK